MAPTIVVVVAPPPAPSTAAGAPRAEPHVAELDGLRGFAALAVLVQHSAPISGINIGMVGVKLFFVLSGFLITGILLRGRAARAYGVSTRTSATIYFLRRGLRILPLYLFALAVGVLCRFPDLADALPWHLTFSGNVLVARDGDFDDGAPPFAHFWSLAVEEQFYLVWPFVVLLAPRGWLIIVVAATVVIGPVSRAAIFLLGFGPLAAKVTTFSCFDSLGMGALVAGLLTVGPAWAKRWFLSARMGIVVTFPVVAMLVGAAITGRGYLVRLVFEDSAFSVLFAWVVGRTAVGSIGPVGRVLRAGPLAYVGKISYGVYVYQGIVPAVLGVTLGWSLPEYGTPDLLFALPAVTIPVAMASWHLMEKPLNDLKRYVPYPARPVENPRLAVEPETQLMGRADVTRRPGVDVSPTEHEDLDLTPERGRPESAAPSVVLVVAR
jgi:peptidoglycan/LPS O-acetylase OafA/YrhL